MLAATAASVMGVPPTGTAAGTGLKANSLHHVSFQVHDYAKTRDYMVSLLGMRIKDDDPVKKFCRLSFGDPSYSTYLVFRNLHPNAPIQTPHVDHMRIVVADWDKPGQAPRALDQTHTTPDGIRLDLGGSIGRPGQ